MARANAVALRLGGIPSYKEATGNDYVIDRQTARPQDCRGQDLLTGSY